MSDLDPPPGSSMSEDSWRSMSSSSGLEACSVTPSTALSPNFSRSSWSASCSISDSCLTSSLTSASWTGSGLGSLSLICVTDGSMGAAAGASDFYLAGSSAFCFGYSFLAVALVASVGSSAFLLTIYSTSFFCRSGLVAGYFSMIGV